MGGANSEVYGDVVNSIEATSYSEDQFVDIYNLHHEWRKQSMLYMKWGKRYARAIKEKTLAEEELKLIRAQNKRALEEKKAELDLDIRKEPVKYGFDKKPNEGAILAKILLDPGIKELESKNAVVVKEAVDEWAKCIENEEVMSTAKLAMSHKKAALEREAELWIAGYFSDPRIPAEVKEIVESEGREKHEKGLKRTMLKRRSKV